MATLIAQPTPQVPLGLVRPSTAFDDLGDVQPVPSLGEIAGAAFRTENTIGSIVAAGGGYDAWGEPIEWTPEMIVGTPLEGRPEEIASIRTLNQYHARMEHFRQQARDREVLGSAGGMGIALSMAASIFDPINLLPFSSGMKSATLLRSVANIAGGAVAGAALQEATLSATQDFRTREEIAMNLGSALVIGSALGVVGGLIGRRARTRFEAGVKQMVDPDVGLIHQRNGRTFAGNAAVEAELRRVRTEGGRLDDASIADIYTRFGTEIDDTTASGRFTTDGELYISKAAIDEMEASFATREEPVLDPEAVVEEQVASLRALREERAGDALAEADAVAERYAREGCGV